MRFIKGNAMHRLIIGTLALLGLALAVAAVSSSRTGLGTGPSHREPTLRRSAAGPARAAARFGPPGHFLPGRAGLPQ
jgi:hypothetical protein